MGKQPRCCARLFVKLRQDESDLAGLARKAVRADQRGDPIGHYKTKIAEAKRVIAGTLETIEQHDADHAGEGS